MCDLRINVTMKSNLKSYISKKLEQDIISFDDTESYGDSLKGKNISDHYIESDSSDIDMDEEKNKRIRKILKKPLINNSSDSIKPVKIKAKKKVSIDTKIKANTKAKTSKKIVKKHTSKSNTDSSLSDNCSSDSSSESSSDKSGSEDPEIKKAREKYLKHMNKIVEQIKEMKWGDEIMVESDPMYSHISGSYIKYCTVSKIRRFNTYMFRGYGSKSILRYFMNQTKADPELGYQKIVQILDSKSFRRFLPIKNWKELWNAYKDEPINSRHIFELIRSDQPCKPYLDIEWMADYTEDPRIEDYSEFLDRLQKDIIQIFKNRYKISINKKNIMISYSHSEKKVSFHIVINKIINGQTVGFKTNRKGYPESAWDLWYALVKSDDGYEDVLDGAVYTTDREFRVIFSNKTSEFRPVIPYEIKDIPAEDSLVSMKTNECLKYIITYSESGEYYHIKTPDVPKKYLSQNSLDSENGIWIPRTYSDQKVNRLIELLKPIHRTAEYTGPSGCGKGWRFSYSDKMEQCYSGEYHESNGFYVFENIEKGIIYMKCMSSDCKGIKILEKNKKNDKKKLIPTKKLF
jgi:hypothetical protein